MTLGAWKELITNYLGSDINTDLRTRYHPAIIAEYFNIVYQDVISTVYTQTAKTSDFGSLDAYCKAFENTPVEYSIARDEYYSIIPASYLTLPRNRGIRQISPMQDQSCKFLYRENNNVDVYSELEVSKVIPYTAFYVEGNKVFYSNYNTLYSNSGLLFKLICPLSEFGNDDEIGIPASQSGVIFEKIVTLLRQKPPQKDGVDKTEKQI